MYCQKLFEGLDKRLSEKKSIDVIAAELCPDVSKKRDKIIRLIKSHMGGSFLRDNSDWLQYHSGNIRNHNTGTAAPMPIEKRKHKDERLFKPNLGTRLPRKEDCERWVNKLDNMINILDIINSEMDGTTAGKHTWKVNAISKRIKELKMIFTHHRL